MPNKRRRTRPTFWEMMAEHLLSELRSILQILPICCAATFLLVSLLVGIYHVLRSMLLWLVMN